MSDSESTPSWEIPLVVCAIVLKVLLLPILVLLVFIFGNLANE